jgi:hypothetical protein
VARLGQQVELVKLPVTEEDFADVPDHALVDRPLSHAQAIQDLQGPLGEADGAAAFGGLVVLVQQQHIHAVLSEVDGHTQPNRAGTNHGYPVAAGRAGRKLRRLAVDERLSLHDRASGRPHYQ